MPKISMIVPVYKVEKYLECCVDSIRNQTFQDLEILLVDDGSPDRCPAMCDELARQDSRIRVIHKENGGVCSARNAGLEAASGEYIAFVDSDDYLDPGMYEKMLEKAGQNDCDVVMCDCRKEFPDHTELYTHEIREGFYSRKQLETEYFPHLLMMENVEYPATISNWLLLFRRKLVQNVRYLTGVRYSEDLLFGAQLMYRASSFYYMKGEAYYHYRMNPESATHKFVPDKWNDYLKLHAGIKREFGTCQEFDFTGQIDLCLLFFLYNTIGDINGTDQLSRQQKVEKIRSILQTPDVAVMFDRISVHHLLISGKQKVITYMYKYRACIPLLVKYYECK